MLISKVAEQKKNKKRFSIYVDGEYYCSVDKDVLDEINIREGMNFEEKEFSNIIDKMNYKSALKSALSILVRAPRTENELARKLRQKQYPEAAINKVIEYLCSIGYINDEEYAESLIRSLKSNKGCSKRTIYYKLIQKGIDSDIINQKLGEVSFDEFAAAFQAAAKKVTSIKGSSREKMAKTYTFLMRKGFDTDTCSKVISELQLPADSVSDDNESCE